MADKSERGNPTGGDPQSKDRQWVIDFELVRRIGGRNLRDLGGHPTRDGHQVKAGHIFRSAHLATIHAQSPLRELKLKTVVTLQSEVEVAVLGPPHPELFGAVRWKHIPIGDKWFRDGESRTTIKPGHEHLVLVTDFKPAWQEFFTLLAERAVYPLLFHCSAGRDRTGVGAAMLLELLGVERDRIAADFLKSNNAFPRLPLAASQLDPLFAQIDRSGGIETFLTRDLGVVGQSLIHIRQDLLED